MIFHHGEHGANGVENGAISWRVAIKLIFLVWHYHILKHGKVLRIEGGQC
jgi:hypothetical protein